MPRAHPQKVREICIRQYRLGLDPKTINILTGIPVRTVYDWIDRWKRSGSVLTDAERYGDNRGRPRVISDDDLIVMCQVWTQDPTLFIDEVALEMTEILNRWIDPRNLIYWKKQLGITRKKLWQVCIC